MPTKTRTLLKVADEVWIATALLHRDRPNAQDFSIDDIMAQVRVLGLTSQLRPGVYVHVVQHCVANRAPNPGRYRVLYETAPGRRRLFRQGDPSHPDREGGKVVPDPGEVPDEYRSLLDWYRDWCAARRNSDAEADPLLALAGSGKDLWSDEHADAYVTRLREDWK